ncbi:MAG: biopolymer transporter ExbD [Paramuribaculum sp.]|nr:biopolymer transporter ExbD [Paramuribaculum sp.]MDE6304489.1 biopolymer transporter ExbD [Paramuribaculum sp.]
MALKRQFDMTSVFSMASMTDVIFLLLIFFMVTSTFVFPTALEINLPQSSEQTAIKPATRVYIDEEMKYYVSTSDGQPVEVAPENLAAVLVQLVNAETAPVDPLNPAVTPERFIAVYADESVNYGKLVEVLNIGAENGLKMVLATKPAPASALPAAN